VTPAAAPAATPRRCRRKRSRTVPRSVALRASAELVVARDALRVLAGDRGPEVLRLLGALVDAAVDSNAVSDDELNELDRQFKHAVVTAVAETMRPILARRQGTRRARSAIHAAAPVAAIGGAP